MTLTAAILCPGPSLPTYPGRAGIDLVIGVNRAAQLYVCDYWVFCDDVIPKITRALERPILVCDRAALHSLRHTPFNGHTFIDRETAGPVANHPIRWRRYSATSALVLAYGLGATEIRCWGIDRAGVEDWDGTLPPHARRTEERWREEASIWGQLVDELAAADVRVVLSGKETSS